MVDQLPKIECKHCGHKSIRRVEKPLKCPKCQKKYEYEEVKK